jgi:hypothetical protein
MHRLRAYCRAHCQEINDSARNPKMLTLKPRQARTLSSASAGGCQRQHVARVQPANEGTRISAFQNMSANATAAAVGAARAGVVGRAAGLAPMASRTSPSPAMSPELSYALAHVEGGGAILALWLPMAVFGHIFVAVFLLHGLFLYMPRLRRCGRLGVGLHEHGSSRWCRFFSVPKLCCRL